MCINNFKGNELQLFDSPYRWIIFCQDECSHMFQHLDISISSDISICRVNKNDSIMVEKIYKYVKNGVLILENWGYWPLQGIFIHTQIENNLYRRRNNLRKISLNTCIVVTNNDSLKHLTDKR